MSDYSNTYGGAAKDAANDIILGAQLDTQFDAVAVASQTKLDEAGGTMTGVLDQNDETDSTTGGSGSIHTDGGIGAVKDIVTDANFKPLGGIGTGDKAAFGYTASSGAGITGQGSTNDVILINDAAQIALRIPTGTQDVVVEGTLIVAGDTSSGDAAAVGQTTTDGLILTGQGSTNDVVLKNDIDAIALRVPTGTQNVHVGADLDVTGDAVVDGTQLTTGIHTVTAGVVTGGVIVSDTDSTDDIGTTSVRFKELFIDTITITDFDSPRSVTKFKTADQTINNSSSNIDDTHLAGWTLDAASYYKINGWLLFNVGNSATVDLTIIWQLSQTPVDGGFSMADIASSASEAIDTEIIVQMPTNSTIGRPIQGYVQTHATLSTTFDMQWSQNNAESINLIHRKGSWITITKMS